MRPGRQHRRRLHIPQLAAVSPRRVQQILRLSAPARRAVASLEATVPLSDRATSRGAGLTPELDTCFVADAATGLRLPLHAFQGRERSGLLVAGGCFHARVRVSGSERRCARRARGRRYGSAGSERALVFVLGDHGA